MKKIGVLFGMENTFPGALVERINSMDIDGIKAEFVQVGGVQMAAPSGYAVIVDRISHDMPFYRAFLKNAALTGTQIINNPFWWSADDKFFNYALASKLGVAVPKTALIPHKHFPPQINEKSLRNLEFPLNWQRIFDYVGFPAFLKPHDGGGWRDVFHVHSPEEFFRAYDQTRDLCMTLQAAVKFKEYFRCYVVGQSLRPRPPARGAIRPQSASVRSEAVEARREGCADPVQGARLRPQHGRVRGRRRHPVRDRLHESRTRRGPAFGGQRELRVDSRCRGEARSEEGAEAGEERIAVGGIVAWDCDRGSG
jgi:hypothetical protein